MHNDLMFQADHILTFVHPGSAAQAALEQATSLAIACHATLSVVPVGAAASLEAASEESSRRMHDASGFSSSDGSRQAEASPAQQTRQCIEAVARLSSADAPTYTVVDPPSSLGEMVAQIAEASIDLIVADTPADRGAIPVLASEPVASIARSANVPVFVVEHRSIREPIRRILVPTDFSEHARRALAHAKGLAQMHNASLDVLHVLERPQYVALNTTDMLAMSDATLAERKAERRAEALLGSIRGGAVPARVHISHGDAADCIGHFVDEHPTDLLVVSTHGAIGQPHRPLGSVVEKVLRRVAHPVFLTRAFGRSVVSDAFLGVGSDGAPGRTPNIDAKGL